MNFLSRASISSNSCHRHTSSSAFLRKCGQVATTTTTTRLGQQQNQLLSSLQQLPCSHHLPSSTTVRSFATFPAPRLFDYETVTANLSVTDAIESVEHAFGALAQGKVDVPMPMHIGIHETTTAGPGDCHIKGGYVLGAPTFTVKLACVSFYKNLDKGLPAGSGLFCVVDAVTGAPLAMMQENRFMTDLRTGAAGAVAVKYTCPNQDYGKGDGDVLTVGFIGAGAIARNMARAAKAVRPNMKGVVFGLAGGPEFAQEMSTELGVEVEVAESAKALCEASTVIFTQTPGSQTVLELDWLQPGTTIIASGSDQPTKQEIPNNVLKAGKYISDLTKQTSKVGELRGAIQAGVMTTDDVYAELGEVVNGSKPGRENENEIIVVDLTGTGAQDAAIGQVAWDKLSAL